MDKDIKTINQGVNYASIGVAALTLIATFFPYIRIEKDSYNIWSLLFGFKPLTGLGFALVIVPVIALIISLIPDDYRMVKIPVLLVVGIGEIILRRQFDLKLYARWISEERFKTFTSAGHTVYFVMAILIIVVAAAFGVLTLINNSSVADEEPSLGNSMPKVDKPVDNGNTQNKMRPMSDPSAVGLSVNNYKSAPTPKDDEFTPTHTMLDDNQYICPACAYISYSTTKLAFCKKCGCRYED